MTSRVIPVDPFTLVVFGATGDLSRRKLLPAMMYRDLAGQLPESARIVGVGRRDLTRADFQAMAHESVASLAAARNGALEHFISRIDYVKADAGDDDGWDRLREVIDERPDDTVVYYLATSPDLFVPISDSLGRHGLNQARSRIVLEKPIGKAAASALKVNEGIGRTFPEASIYRIDHYLGKETVQNLMALRFANALFEPLWSAAHIDHVQITVAEELGVEGRAGYYDTAGAMRDMVQNHILQLLCLVAMEPPSSMKADAVRDEKLKVLKSLKRIDSTNAAHMTVRGQYRAGASAGGAVPGYLEELEGPSSTETFVAIKAEIGNWRWAGVPFYLRTGKRLPSRVSEIIVSFRKVPHAIFDGGRVETESIGHPPAAERRNQAVLDDQGSGAWRHAPPARVA